MKVNVQSVNFNAEGKLIDFVQSRLNKLDQFYDKIISSDVYLKVENTSSKENKIVEIKVHVPKDQFIPCSFKIIGIRYLLQHGFHFQLGKWYLYFFCRF